MNKPAPTPADIQEACDLFNETIGGNCSEVGDYSNSPILRAISQLIAERKVERRRVSDAVKAHQKADGVEDRSRTWDALLSFILPDPEPTPEEVLRDAFEKANYRGDGYYAGVFKELAAQGYELTKIKGGDNGVA